MGKVSVIGDGGWGTAIALLLVSKGVDTILWSVSAEYAGEMNRSRENTKFLQGVKISKELQVTADDSVAGESDHIIFVVPCEYMRPVLERFKRWSFKTITTATKGIEVGSLKRPSEIVAEYFDADITTVSGPSISFEVARGYPSTVVAASKGGSRRAVQDILMSDRFRVYTSGDIVGVELGGALKNVIAIAAGISDGLGFGANSKAAILTRGLAEITRLGVSMGADRATFSGLSGIGDLATTCISLHSRNRWLGQEIGKGRKVDELLSGTEMAVEGYLTARSAYELSRKYDVDMPITEKVYEVLYEGMGPEEAVQKLMTREPKEEKG